MNLESKISNLVLNQRSNSFLRRKSSKQNTLNHKNNSLRKESPNSKIQSINCKISQNIQETNLATSKTRNKSSILNMRTPASSFVKLKKKWKEMLKKQNKSMKIQIANSEMLKLNGKRNSMIQSTEKINKSKMFKDFTELNSKSWRISELLKTS